MAKICCSTSILSVIPILSLVLKAKIQNNDNCLVERIQAIKRWFQYFVMDMPFDIRITYKKNDFKLPGNLTDASIILDAVQLPVKNHLFFMCLLMTYTELVVTENPNIELTHQIKVCYYLKANKADCTEP